MQTKTCTKCREVKPVSDFWRKRNGLHTQCKDCCKARNRTWMAANYSNREEVKARNKAYKAEHRDKLNTRKRDWYVEVRSRPEYRDHEHEMECLRKFGITKTEALEKAGHRCAICGNTLVRKAPNQSPEQAHMDHCHSTGIFRGVLCSWCNTALGKFRDDPKVLLKAADYLTQFEIFK